jgi:hypothetical protein
VDAFIAQSKLRTYKIFYKGQPRLRSKPDGRKSGRTGCTILVSKADFDNLEGQIKDVISYLKRNNKKLLLLTKTKGIELATLDFGIDARTDGKDHLMQSETFPSELLRLAGNLGLSIEISLYSPNMQEVLEKQRNTK